MARRKVVTLEADASGALILPRHLVDQRGLTGSEHREFNADRRAWFAAHGVNPGDWSEVHPILTASWETYGIECGALRRARLKVRDESAGPALGRVRSKRGTGRDAPKPPTSRKETSVRDGRTPATGGTAPPSRNGTGYTLPSKREAPAIGEQPNIILDVPTHVRTEEQQ